MLASLYPVRDIRLSGQVVYTGTSSMEVAVKMEALGSEGEEETLMLGTCQPRRGDIYGYTGDTTDYDLSHRTFFNGLQRCTHA